MWRTIMKMWIATIILSTVSSTMVEYDENSAVQPPPRPCWNCTKSSESLQQLVGNGELSFRRKTRKFIGNNKLQFKRGVGLSAQGLTKSDVENPRVAICEVTSQLINFKDDEVPDSSYYYNPPCTRVDRCSGCCSDSKECLPVDQTIRQFRIHRIPDVLYGNVGTVVKDVVEHRSCECNCRIKSEDCKVTEQYDEENCRCKCRNRDRQNCLDAGKSFDVDTCSCTCINSISRICNTYLVFDEDTCKCELDPTSRLRNLGMNML